MLSCMSPHRLSLWTRSCLGVTVSFFLCLLNGCAGPGWILEPLLYAGNGGISPQTQMAMARDHEASVIARELAGGKPLLNKATWKDYWQASYALIRLELARGHQPEFCRWHIAEIYEQRRRAGPPLYDVQKP